MVKTTKTWKRVCAAADLRGEETALPGPSDGSPSIHMQPCRWGLTNMRHLCVTEGSRPSVSHGTGLRRINALSHNRTLISPATAIIYSCCWIYLILLKKKNKKTNKLLIIFRFTTRRFCSFRATISICPLKVLQWCKYSLLNWFLYFLFDCAFSLTGVKMRFCMSEFKLKKQTNKQSRQQLYWFP